MMWLKILLYIYFKNSEILLFSILENRTANIYAGLLFVKKDREERFASFVCVYKNLKEENK